MLSLKDHQALNKAEYAIVVAGSFAGGKVASHAQEQAVTLLPLKVLEAWIRLHDAWPQDLLVYRSLFTIKGIVDELPNDMLRVTHDRKRWGKLLADIVDLFGDTYENGLREPSSPARSSGCSSPGSGVSTTRRRTSRACSTCSATRSMVLSRRRRPDTSWRCRRETLALRLRRLARKSESLDDQGSAE